jgi:hypothetical protein
MKTWDVCMTFQYPAWDEKGGIWYRGVVAGSRREANKQARRMAANDGHAVGGRGRYFFTATPSSEDGRGR